MLEVLRPFVVREETEHQFFQIRPGDSAADVHLGSDDMMANHVSGEDPWELLVQGTRAAGWVVPPTGRATCITDEAQRAHLPEGLDEDVVLVATRADLIRAIKSA